MHNKVDKIVIIGGGSAGWIVASTMVSRFPQKEIIVIESEQISKVGVGESTVKEITQWIAALGLDIKEVMREVNGTLKMGNKIIDFLNGDDWFFTFYGDINRENSILGISDLLYRKSFDKNVGKEEYMSFYIPQSKMMIENKFPEKDYPELFPFSFNESVAIQLDANKLAIYLSEKYAMPRGVKRIYAKVKSINSNSEKIHSVTTEDGLTVEGDFFVDCTGFRSLITGNHFKEKFISTEHILPNNSAYFASVPYKNQEVEMELFTRATALKNGWCWNIPVWDRMGTGYVYSDKFTDDESALTEFKNYLDSSKMKFYSPNRSEGLEIKKLKMRNGYYERRWILNSCSLGIASSFIDPLESAGLIFVHSFAEKIADIFEKGFYTHADSVRFNNVFMVHLMDNIKAIKMEFVLSKREDSEYWKFVRQPNENYDLLSTINKDNFKYLAPAILSKIIGMDFSKLSDDSLIDLGFKNEHNLQEELARLKNNNDIRLKKIENLVKKMPSHYQYLKDNVHV